MQSITVLKMIMMMAIITVTIVILILSTMRTIIMLLMVTLIIICIKITSTIYEYGLICSLILSIMFHPLSLKMVYFNNISLLGMY